MIGLRCCIASYSTLPSITTTPIILMSAVVDPYSNGRGWGATTLPVSISETSGSATNSCDI